MTYRGIGKASVVWLGNHTPERVLFLAGRGSGPYNGIYTTWTLEIPRPELQGVQLSYDG